MDFNIPAIICLFGALVFFLFMLRIRRINPAETLTSSSDYLSLRDKQQRKKIASMVAFLFCVLLLVAGLYLMGVFSGPAAPPAQ